MFDLIKTFQDLAPALSSIFSIIGIVLGALFHMRSAKKFELDKTIEAFEAVKDELAHMQQKGEIKDLQAGIEKGVELVKTHRVKKKLTKKSENKLISRLRGFFMKRGIEK